MPALQGLVFDLDGTLLDGAPDIRQALNQTLRAHGRRELSLDEVKHMAGDGLLTQMHRAFSATGEDISDTQSYNRFQEFISAYRALTADPVQIYPHVRETLDLFRGKGVRFGLCTNKQEAATHQLLHQLDLARYFAFVAGGDTFPVHKPHPDHVHGILKKLQVAPENVAMVGDSKNDVLAAHAAGIPCIVVTQGYDEDVQSLGADHFIDSFADLPAALTKLGFV